MTQEATRASILTRIEEAKAAWSAYTLLVDYENRDVIDLANQTNPYVAVDIVWLDGEQLDLNPSPLTCDYGQIIIAAGVKEGAGQLGVIKLLDHFRPYLELRDDMGAVRTHAAKPHAPVRKMGFYYLPLVIGFWTVAVSTVYPPGILDDEDGTVILEE